MSTPTLGIVGLGHVGSAILQEAVTMGIFGRIVCVDKNEGMARGDALDNLHSTALNYVSNVDVRAGGYDALAGADVIIVAAGPSIIPNKNDPSGKPDRALLAGINAKVTNEVVGCIKEYTTDAVVIVATNPLDAMVWVGENVAQYPEGRLFGTGTALDSARLRSIVAKDFDIDPKNVHGYMLGEHGLSAFPVMSRLRVAGLTPKEAEASFGVRIDEDRIRKEVVDSAYEVLNGKGFTSAGVARTALMLARAVLIDERSIYTVSTTLRGEYGYDGDVATSVPSLIGAGGVKKRLEIPLNDVEKRDLADSVAAIKVAISDARAALEV